MNELDRMMTAVFSGEVTSSMLTIGIRALEASAGASKATIAKNVYRAMHEIWASQLPDRVLGKPVAPQIDREAQKRALRKAGASREAARKRGVKFGPRPKLSAHQKQLVRTRKAAGESNRAIAKDLGVSYKTIERTA